MQFGHFTQVGTVTYDEAEKYPLPTWKQLVRLPEEELAKLDIAFVQFVTMMGIPGSERLKPAACLRTLNFWTDRVEASTARAMYQFRRNPTNFENSEAYFRALCLATVLQKEFGVKYDPAKMPHDVPFGPEDTSVHGIIFGNGGTCASLPVLYAAVGRKLGYPIKLVTVFVNQEVLHLIARWDGDGARFNIEATCIGLATPPDDHYRGGRYEATPLLEKQGRFMESKTPRMELVCFLHERAQLLRRADKRVWTAEALAWAFALDTTK